MGSDSMAGKGRILLAEDDDVFRMRLGKALMQRGFDVVDSGSVADSIALAHSFRIDYAVVDLRFKDGSGLDVIEALKKAQPQSRSVVLTGYGDTATAVAAVKLGALDYLPKPESANEILSVLLAPDGDQPKPPSDPIPPNEARRQHIEAVFKNAGGNVSHAARLLNMHRRTLQRILKRSGTRDSATG